MPIASPEVYADMISRAKEGGFAYPAINCTSSETVNAALRGFADAGSDGIIQVSTGGAEFSSGTRVKDMVTGAVALAEFAHVVAEKYPVQIALHTDHCPKDKLDAYVRPLLALSKDRVDTIEATTRAGYFPGAEDIAVKLVSEEGSGRLLGAQVVGGQGSAKRIDVLATAIWAGLSAEELAGSDLSYAPPFSPTYDPVVVAARVLSRTEQG